MFFYFLGKKLWNVYNIVNIECVRCDEVVVCLKEEVGE